jgi:hypothetical protein
MPCCGQAAPVDNILFQGSPTNRPTPRLSHPTARPLSVRGGGLLLGRMVPASRVGHRGFGRDRAPLGTGASQPYPSDRTTLARCCRGWLVLARNRAAGTAPRRGHRYVGYNPLALMRRSGLHVAAHWASATFMDNSSCRSAAPRRMQLNGRRPVRGEWA